MHFCSLLYRPIRGIGGFTREVVVALTTNIESQVSLYTCTCVTNMLCTVPHLYGVLLLLQEFRRRYGIEKGLSPEHPRVGSTDDVEGIFAFLHGMLGPIFDEKDFHDAFQKSSASTPRNVILTCPFTTTLDPMTDIMMVYFSLLMYHLAVGKSD